MKFSHAFAAALGLGIAGRRSCRAHPVPARTLVAPTPKQLHSPRRRLDHHVVQANETVAKFVQQQHASGSPNSAFTISAVRLDSGDSGGRSLSEGSGEIYSIDVVETQPSVTADTVVSYLETGTVATVDDYVTSQTLLVAANQDAGEFALLVVDANTESTTGMARKSDGELVQWTQSSGDTAVVEQAEPYYPANWTCGVGDSEESVATPVEPVDGRRRSLRDEEGFFEPAHDGHHHQHDHGHDDDHHQHDHDHDHHDHDHDHHDHGHHHEHHHDRDILAQLRADLGHGTRIGKRRALYPTDNFPDTYSYQVDMFIEIDNALISHHGSLNNTISYINALVSATSAIYEREIDTHLHVAQIVVSTYYDSLTTTAEGLSVMETQWGGTTWHYTTGHGIDLHHALLFNNLGGGRASIGGICDPQQGFGISTAITGSASPTPNVGPMYWDIYVFAHEVGHNFGAQHTHDSSRVPLVDTCGIDCPGSSPPAGSTAAGSATIMSYCHQCGGGAAAIGLTFGGSWNEDDRTNVDNWIDNDSIDLSFHTTPKRVPKGMWEYVSTRTCTDTNSNAVVPTVSCTVDSDCHDGIPCTIDTCNSGTCTNTMSNGCCGNFVCEAGEYASCSDCAFTLGTQSGNNLGVGPQDGIMFDVQAIEDLNIQGLTFFAATSPNFNVDLFTVSGGYSGKETNAGAWSQIIAGQSVSSSLRAEVTLSFTEIQLSAGSTQAFHLSTSAGGTFLWDQLSANPVASDTRLSILNPAHAATEPFGTTSYSGTISWSGSVQYKIPEQDSTTNSPTTSPTTSPTSNPSKAPSSSPTNAPTTGSPTGSPSTSPTSYPSASPTSSPTNAPITGSPTSSPTTSPTSGPSNSPSASPTSSPSNSPSTSPTASPSKSPTSNPSKAPSSSPTKAPTTGSPTGSPSTSPTSNPSVSPTSSPTSAPITGSPTSSPTTSPTRNPSASPTSSPTNAPTTGSPTGSPSTSPTSNPSASPTSSPTNAPITGSPTWSPTTSPTTNPSASPTSSPTNAPTTGSPTSSPTTSPTANPSKSPTSSPTNAPTTPFPTMSPTTSAPSLSPTTPSPTTTQPTKSPSNDPHTKVIVPGTIVIENTDYSQLSESERAKLITGCKATIEANGCPSIAEHKECRADITSINGVSQTRRLRRLQSSALLIEYELVIEAICASSDCSDAQTLANQLYAEVTGDLLEAITDGTVISSLQAISSTLNTLLESATISGSFSEVVVPILALLAKWYPDWKGQSGTCKNDGNAPTYMKVFGTYFESTLDACCVRYFGWDLHACTGSTEVPNGFFPNWGGTEQKCINSTESPSLLPNYMRRHSEQWLNADVGSCCEKHFNWVYGDCVRLSGGNSSEVATNKWYVNHQEEICQRDCAEVNGGSCGGLVDPWNALYETVENCCAQKLSWIVPMTCVAQSTGAALVGTSQWYIDWGSERCVKDCDDSSDANCGGIAMGWDELYSSANECCSRLWFIERHQCTL